jgi:hypothetical protein
MTTLEQNIEMAAGNLPPAWSLIIEVENGWGGVKAIRPDGTEVDMDTGDNCLAEQVADAVRLARDENEAYAVSSNEKAHRSAPGGRVERNQKEL